MKRQIAIAIAGGAVLAGVVVPSAAQPQQMVMLDGLQHGNWELRARRDSDHNHRICLKSGRQFIQLRHTNLNCKSVIVDDTATEVTVQYTCPGHGYGRTYIRWETNQLVQIDSQGISDGVPFAFVAEARRIGECRE
ncbi:MAG: hypothetical protein KUG65_09260 [Sphingomonadaceae bacterium]|nr:hypothetical protein [Sphingomonadaceae bacterium]